jgi:hypothetical protein
MRTTAIVTLVIAAILLPHAGTTAQAASTSQKQYVFPAKGQSPETQKKDEADCGNWAVKETGFNPATPPPPPQKQSAPPPPPPQGSTAQGAVRGAAAGYIIGDLANDEGGEGAAIGAVVGASRSRRKSQAAQSFAVQQTEAQYKAALDKYNADLAAKQSEYSKARAACLEAKGYTVK